MLAVRAIYQEGHLKLLEPVNLNNGEEVSIHIISSQDILDTLLEDLIVKSETSTKAIDEDDLQNQLDKATQGITLSDLVIDERKNSR